MKVNFQKFMIIFLIVPMCVSLFALPVYAEDNEHGGTGGEIPDPVTNQQYMSQVSQLIDWYCDGKIDWESYQEQLDSITDNYISSNTFGGQVSNSITQFSNKVSALSQKFGSIVQEYGDSAVEYIKDYFDNFFSDYEVLREESTTDLKGYGALLMVKRDPYIDYYYCDYLEINPDVDIGTCVIDGHECFSYRYWNSDGHIDDGWYTILPQVFAFKWVPRYYTLSYYGDVRYRNGEKAPTNDEYVEVEDYDFADSTYKDLDDLLNKIIEELNRQQPDLSSIEGILKSIYYRLGTLDSDNDSGTLSLLNSAISQLISDNNANNQALIEKLESLKGGTEDSGEEGEGSGGTGSGEGTGDSGGIDVEGLRELLKELIPEIDDMTGTEQVKAALLSKFSFIEELKSLIQRFISSYKNSSSNDPVITLDFGSGLTSGVLGFLGFHDVDLSAGGFLNKYMPTVRAIVAAFIYITFAWNTYKKIPEYINGGGGS